MNLHPVLGKRHLRREPPADLDPIRRSLQENEDWYRDLVDHSRDLLCIHDLQGRLLSVNPAPARALGYTVEELLKLSMRDLIAEEFRPEFDAYLTQIQQTAEAHGLMAVVTRSGEHRIWEYRNTLRTERVAAPIVLGMAHDVTEQLRAQKALAQREADLNRAQKVAHIGSWRYDIRSKAVTISDETCRILGLTEGSGITPEAVMEVLEPDERSHIHNAWFAALEVGRLDIELRIRVRGGQRWVHLQADIQFDSGRRLASAVGTVQDITERKLFASSLEASEKRFRTVYERSPLGICLVNPRTGSFYQVNPKYCEITGRTEQELLGTNLQAITHTDDLAESVRVLRQLEAREIPYLEIDKRYVRPDGSVRWVHMAIVPMFTDVGNPTCSIAIVEDITARKRAEEALFTEMAERARTTKELKLFRALIDQSNDAIEVVDPATLRFLDVNEKACSDLGYSRDELLSMTVYDIAPNVRPDDKRLTRLAGSGSITTSGVHRRKDGSTFPVEASIRHVKLDQEYHVAIVRDITERRRVEETLRQSEERFRSLVRATSQVVWTSPANGQQDGIGMDEWQAFTGQTPEEALGDGWSAAIHPDDRQGTINAWKRAVEGGTPLEIENRLRRHDGVYRHTQVRAVPVLDGTGNLVEWVGMNADITERKQAEEALRQSEARFRIALDGSPVKVFNQDRNLRYTWVYNPQECWVQQDCLGKTDEEIFAPEDAARMTEIKKRALETGHAVREPITFALHGKMYHCDMTVEPLRDATGSIVGVNCACIDVTQLRETADELRRAKEKLAEEKLYLEQAISAELGFGEIIGQSQALRNVMAQVAKVAASDATVLLLGETGTGKELVARAIHSLSKRQDNSFIKLNCAAIPSGLLESELFGHEKGAFTGAISKKIGRLELADRGTLFLDEIGEIPLELQPKLLRVLQDQEFERLGDTRTLKVSFRLIAATNRDLPQSVAEKQFRSDLYYRLSVFPVRLPPLRERRDDIRLLMEHFVRRFAGRMNKPITSIPRKTMDALMQWDWPGNIRELENFAERSVILTHGSVLQAPLGELETAQPATDETLATADREHILRALRETRGRLGGPYGAAARLGLKRTTLQSKLKRLGIEYPRPQG